MYERSPFKTTILITLRSLFPSVLLFLSMILLAVHLPLPFWQEMPPQLPYIILFFWLVYYPHLLPTWLLFIVGLGQDSLVGLPLGASALLFVITKIIIGVFRKALMKSSFLKHWVYFSLSMLVITFISWLLFFMMKGSFVPLVALMFQWLINVFLYPLCAQIFFVVRSKYYQDEF